MAEQEQQQGQPDGSEFRGDGENWGEPDTYLDEDTALMQAELLQDNPDFVGQTDKRLVELGKKAALEGEIAALQPAYGQAREEYDSELAKNFGQKNQWGERTYHNRREWHEQIKPRLQPVLDEMNELKDGYEKLKRQLYKERGYLFGNGTTEMGLQDVEKKVVGPEAVWKLFGELKMSNPELATMPAAEYLKSAKELLAIDDDVASLDRIVKMSQRSVEWCKALKTGEREGVESQSLRVLYHVASRGAVVKYYDYDDFGNYVNEWLSNRVRWVSSEKFDFHKEQDEFFASAHGKTIDELYDAMQVTAERILQARQEEAAETRQRYEETKQALVEWGNKPDNGKDQQIS